MCTVISLQQCFQHPNTYIISIGCVEQTSKYNFLFLLLQATI